MCNTKYGQVNKFQESLISSDAYKRKEMSAHISFLAKQMDFDSKLTKCSFTDAHNVAILSHKGLLCSYANRRKIYTRGAVRRSVKNVRRLLPFRRLCLRMVMLTATAGLDQ